MQRKEVYATTGSRIRVRVFGGWDFGAEEAERQNFAEQGDKRGVPLGGDLSGAPDGKAPCFMVRALRDPDNANIDEVCDMVVRDWTAQRRTKVCEAFNAELRGRYRVSIEEGNSSDRSELAVSEGTN